ncbi:hypothetical protein L9F63_007827, partial [Diploptera punctata]
FPCIPNYKFNAVYYSLKSRAREYIERDASTVVIAWHRVNAHRNYVMNVIYNLSGLVSGWLTVHFFSVTEIKFCIINNLY